MSEENMDANQGAESSSAPQQETGQDQTPEGAQSSSNQSTENGTNPNVPFHEHPRFKELISEKNQLRRELEELHSKLSSVSEPKVNTALEVEQDLIKAGIKPEVAKTLALSMDKVSSAKVAPVEAATLEQEVMNTAQKFAESHEDFKSVQKDMYELYASLPKDLADAIAKDKSGKGLQFLYNSAKETKIKEVEKAAYDKGIQDGYKQKNLKSSVSPNGGHSAPMNNNPVSEDDVRNMSLEKYKKNRTKILESFGTRVQ